MSTSSSVPPSILNHDAFQSALKACPVGPEALYNEFLTQAHGSQDLLKELLDNYFERRAAIPKIGQGQGKKRQVVLDYGVTLALTYVAINTIPQYLVEMVVQPENHTVLAAPWQIHGMAGGSDQEERLEAVNGIYYMAVNQGFCVRNSAGTTGYFAIPEPPPY